MDEWKKDRIASAFNGTNPMVLAKMRSGYAVMGDTQFLEGYCLLLAYPKASCLNDLTILQRQQFLVDMSLIGDAITAVCNPHRINYDILGNTDHYLHAHIFPRYDSESEERRLLPVWLYPKENWSNPQYAMTNDRHGQLKIQLTQKLNEFITINYK